MITEWLEFDRVTKRINDILEGYAEQLGIEIISAVLYGSRARGDRNSQNDYEIMILVNNNAELSNYIKFNDAIRFALLKEKLIHVKILTYTPEVFEDILYNDNVAGTILFIMCRENIVLYDKLGTFTFIKEKLTGNVIKSEEKFLEQCVDFAKMLGSEKWERKWEKNLMQFQYLKKRKSYL
jgi:uncharacterized protein